MLDEETNAQVRKSLLEYLDTDTIWYLKLLFVVVTTLLTFPMKSFFHDNPDPLVRLQTENWTPLLDWARNTFDVKINVSNSILSEAQPKETKEKLTTVLESLNQWELAGTS